MPIMSSTVVVQSPIIVLVQKRLQYLELKVEGPLQAPLAAATPEAPGGSIGKHNKYAKPETHIPHICRVLYFGICF